MHPGAWLDRHLPFPRERRALRRWRRTRPFWGGLYLVLGGTEIILIPMSPLSILITLGVGGLAALGIGAVLVVAGLCLWFLPAQRHFVSLVALIASVVSFAATNLGGFLVGMALGIVGSSMGFGWRPKKPLAPQKGSPDPSASAAARPEPDPAEPDGRSAGGTGTAGLALAVPLVLVATLLFPAAGRAYAGPARGPAHGTDLRGALDAAAHATVAGARPPTVTSSFFAPIGFAFVGIVEVPTANGPLKAMKLTMNAASLRDYRLTTHDPGPAYAIAADQLDLNGDVTIYVTRLYGCIEGLICLTFAADGLPLPPIIPPFVFMTRVEADQALVGCTRLTTKNLAIKAV
ncbi:DUF6114 domain-containing protein [Yinghuangia seranimata]|uniref:DUF6114 domain-containing protein n=1 Tax=Yinghuangia seranimata TaxID=408067 RepID=UPI00248CF642|nr:DUF6114 domain-containing protein [Yinghuangia seranimata]MDI2130029.1 DUF6114 domain-containing protein [Yinghuangia seranimata]